MGKLILAMGPDITQTMENCKGVVMFCPMLAILFVGTRMFALQITDSKGSPQGWVQDGMYMATWSLLIQFVMVLVTPCATGVPGQVDEDGNVTLTLFDFEFSSTLFKLNFNLTSPLTEL